MNQEKSSPEQLNLDFDQPMQPENPEQNLPKETQQPQPDVDLLHEPDDPYESLGGGLPSRRNKKRGRF